MKKPRNTLTFFLTAVFVMFAGFVTPAQAIAPAGTKLSITVKVTHDDDGGESEEKKSVGFTIEMSPEAPALSEPADQEGVQGTVETYTYTITTESNGPDTFKLSAEVMPIENIDDTNAAVEFFQNGDPNPITSVELGATAASQFAPAFEYNNNSVYVPSGGTDSGPVNLIEVEDTVVIGNVAYGVSGIIYDTLYDEKMISLDKDLGADVKVGDLVAERQIFEMVVKGLEITNPDLPASFKIVVKATSNTDETAFVVDETLTSFIPVVESTLKIFVRNISEPTQGVDPAYISISNAEFFNADIVTASAGDSVEYAIVQEAGNAQALTGTKVQASIPMFSSYVLGSTALNNNPEEDTGVPLQSPLIEGMSVNSPGLEGTGTIAINKKAEVTFKVQMNVAAEQPVSEPASLEKVAWTPDLGPVCWDEIYAQTNVNGWVIGDCLAWTAGGSDEFKMQLSELGVAQDTCDTGAELSFAGGGAVWQGENALNTAANYCVTSANNATVAQLHCLAAMYCK